MAYPKKKATAEMSRMKQPKMSEERKQRLLALQQREELKGMLVNKFIQKYGQKQKGNINREVENYVKNNKISEGGLKELEEKIKKEGDTRLPQLQDDQKSVKSVRSNKSLKSQHSRHSRT